MITSPNRLVAIATPLIFAPLAGFISTWAAQNAPGADLSAGQLEAVFLAGATIAVAKAGLWMKGWQEHEKRQETMPVAALVSDDEMMLADEQDMDFDEMADADLEGEGFDDDMMAELEAMDEEFASVPAQGV